MTEIVVTARRTSESLQSVPVSMQAITSAEIQKLAITQTTEIAKLAPGLTLSLSDPNTPVVILRGVRWTQASGTPAIPIYLNEISFDPVQVLQTLYDVGQVEVLRGPQGTARGAPSISGAVTITSKQPVMNEFGGYASGQYGEHGHENLQAALNIPLITDKLAIRLAGDIDDSQGNTVRSLNNSNDPYVRNTSGRISVRFEPVDTVSINAMFQRLDQRFSLFTQVAGPGSAGIPALGVPANYNSPPIAADDYRAVQALENTGTLRSDLFTLNASWDVLGQRLSYNFGSQRSRASDLNSIDPANALIGFDARSHNDNPNPGTIVINELRLSSLRGEHPFFDYDLGVYYQRNKADPITFDTIGAFLPGAFGAPGGLNSPFVNPTAVERYSLLAHSDIALRTKDYSAYGNLILHLPYDIELSGGLRWIHDRRPASVSVQTGSAFAAALQNPLAGILTCEQLAALSPAAAGLTTSPIYAGVCDFPISAMNLGTQSYGKTYTPTIWNVSLSHKFTPDLLAYGTVGTSWRAGLPAINNNGLPDNLLFPAPEKATSYELGVKSTFGKVRINADIFQINYQGQLTQFGGVPYFNTVGNSVSQTSIAFFSNVDARVRGLEAEIYSQPIHNLTLDANLSYAMIQSKGGSVPCNDPSRVLSAANPMNFCDTPAGRSLNASPPFQASLNGSYDVPIGPVDGYVRAVINYQGHNPNFGASDFGIKAYTLVDFYAGVSGGQGAWDVGLYAKNIFDKETVLTSQAIITGFGVDDAFGSPGLSRVTATQPREIGVQARYAFGTR